ncbi:hypothetical protein [Deinococcus sp. QL22]|uniref:hypothetical protein n=1 Tax=Deinococcus sp. QL22 TaxID=2939437 RepID=UPI0020174E61|nr:hypothetical protein [Deinococcus sp. QL22]UQN09557.1 hypothetical protein M1R55_25760 [Deinococcus sp. QL22]
MTTIVTWQSQRSSSAVPLRVVEPKLACIQPPRFRIGYQREGNGVSLKETEVDFQGFAWIEAAVCSAGTLTITADGEVAANEAPILQVALDRELLLQEGFEDLKTVKVRVPHRGRLVIGYFNDYYLSDVRVATLEAFKFTGVRCNEVNIDVPKSTGGEWNTATRTASLIFSVPMTIRPCSAGILSVGVLGRAGLNVFPNLTFRQKNIVLKSIQTSAQPQNIALQVMDTPISVTLNNPYFKQLADRNLNIRALVFTPDRSTAP